MVKTIKYVTGFPKGETPKTNDFERFRQEHGLGSGNIAVWHYSGPLSEEDFNVLTEVFCSDQFHELKGDKKRFFDRLRQAVKGEQPLTRTSYSGTFEEPKKNKYVKELDEVQRVSNEFVGELERAIEGGKMPTSAVEAHNFVLEDAKKRGLFVPASHFFPIDKINDSDLSYDTRALVFIDEILCGEVTLRKTGAYHDHWAGYTEEGKTKVNVLGQERETDWNSFSGNSLRWTVDPVIRKEILGEKEGVIITCL
jgi:hypothetical protein